MKNDAPKKAALFGILAAEAIAISFLEGLLPSFIAIPGVKPGFSNIVTMFSVSALGFSYGLAVTLFKAVFALLTRGLTAFFMSLSGGILSLIAMFIMFKFFKKTFGYIGIGIISAVFHNIGQLITAVFILGKSVLGLSPYLLIMGVITGILTGTIFKYTIPFLSKQVNSLIRKPSADDVHREGKNKE